MRANGHNPPGSYFPQFRTYLNPFIKSAGEEKNRNRKGGEREGERERGGGRTM